MGLVARLDDFGKLAWIGLMVLGFVLFWPIGLAMLFFLIGSGRLGGGRMGCSRHERGEWRQRWKDMKREFRRQRHEARYGERDNGGHGFWGGSGRGEETSGNRAFDDYKEETLRRLEAEQKEFYEFLDRLRHAKDKQEFDQFMAERRNRPQAPESRGDNQGDAPSPAA